MTTVDRIAEPWGSRTPYGRVRARLRISGIREGVLFLPFHYGYWDTPGGCAPQERDGRAANELTMTDWDPVSTQPLFKTAAARLSLVERGDGAAAPAPTTTGSRPVASEVPATAGGTDARVDETVAADGGSGTEATGGGR